MVQNRVRISGHGAVGCTTPSGRIAVFELFSGQAQAGERSNVGE